VNPPAGRHERSADIVHFVLLAPDIVSLSLDVTGLVCRAALVLVRLLVLC
jgi:hypothetical protein